MKLFEPRRYPGEGRGFRGESTAAGWVEFPNLPPVTKAVARRVPVDLVTGRREPGDPLPKNDK